MEPFFLIPNYRGTLWACLSTVAAHVHLFMTAVYLSSNGNIKQEDEAGHKAQIISNLVY